MTKFQFISDLINIINGLLQAGVTGCSVHELRGYLDGLFDSFEENEGLLCDDINDRGDLEMYAYLIDSLYQYGYQLWQEDSEAKKATKPKEENTQFCTTKYFQELNDIISLPFGEFDGGVDFNAS